MNFKKRLYELENLNTFKSMVHSLEQNKVSGIPIDNITAAQLTPEYRRDPYLIASRIYESNLHHNRYNSEFPKRNIYGNTLNLNRELPLKSRHY